MSVGKVWADVPKCSAKGYNQLVPIHQIKGHEMHLKFHQRFQGVLEFCDQT
jgi:hypothetical protein